MSAHLSDHSLIQTIIVSHVLLPTTGSNPIRSVSAVTTLDFGLKMSQDVSSVNMEKLSTNKLKLVNAHQAFLMLMVMENVSLVMPLHSTTLTATPV